MLDLTKDQVELRAIEAEARHWKEQAEWFMERTIELKAKLDVLAADNRLRLYAAPVPSELDAETGEIP